ncbi:MAG: hypothetical protein ACK5NC_10405 [Vibrio sp.]
MKNNHIVFIIFSFMLIGCRDGLDDNNQSDNDIKDRKESLTVSDVLSEIDESGGFPLLERSSSIEGDDDNSNGIRDDIEDYIDGLSDTSLQKSALKQMSKSISDAMQMSLIYPDEAELRNMSVSIGNAVHCIWANYDSNVAINKVSEIRKLTANTKERFEAYNKYNNMVSGTSTRLPKGDTCEK